MKSAKVVWVGLALATLVLPMAPASAAPSLRDIQRQIVALQEQAAASAEGAQAAKVQLEQLSKTLSGIRQQAAVQGASVGQLRKSLGAIAISQYQSGGLSQGLELLFSSDPTLYLSSAGSLDAITRRKSLQLHRYATARQRLDATTLTVNDKLALVRATQARLAALTAMANSKLKDV